MARGIDWSKVSVLRSAVTNRIYLGKPKADGTAADKSDDRTDEVVAAVMGYMDDAVNDGEVGMEIRCEAGTLTWIKQGFQTRQDLMDKMENTSNELTLIVSRMKEIAKDSDEFMLILKRLQNMSEHMKPKPYTCTEPGCTPLVPCKKCTAKALKTFAELVITENKDRKELN